MTSLRAAPPGSSMHSHPWQTPGKSAPSPVLPAIKDYDDETGILLSGPSSPHALDEQLSPASIKALDGRASDPVVGGQRWSSFVESGTTGMQRAGLLALGSLSFGSTVGGAIASGAIRASGSGTGDTASTGDRSGASSSQSHYQSIAPFEPRPPSSELLLLRPPHSPPTEGLSLSQLAVQYSPPASLNSEQHRPVPSVSTSGGRASSPLRAPPRKAHTSAGAALAATASPAMAMVSPGMSVLAGLMAQDAASATAAVLPPRPRPLVRSHSMGMGSLSGPLSPLADTTSASVPGAAAAVAAAAAASSSGAAVPTMPAMPTALLAAAERPLGGLSISARLKSTSQIHMRIQPPPTAAGPSMERSLQLAQAQQQAQQAAQAQQQQQQQTGVRWALPSPPAALFSKPAPTAPGNGGGVAVTPLGINVTPGGLSPPHRSKAAPAPAPATAPGPALAPATTPAPATAPALATAPTPALAPAPVNGRGRGHAASSAPHSAGTIRSAQPLTPPQAPAGGTHPLQPAQAPASPPTARSGRLAASAPLPRLPELALYSPPSVPSEPPSGQASAAGGAAAAPLLRHTAGLVVEGGGGGDGGGGVATMRDSDVPTPPEVVVRPPRWLKPSAFQITEKLRSGRLQELVDSMAAVSAPTLLDLGGLEFSGSFAMPPPAAAGGGGGGGGGSASASASVHNSSASVHTVRGHTEREDKNDDDGASAGSAPRHRALFFSPSGQGGVSVSGSGGGGGGGGGGNARYRRNAGPITAGLDQVLSVPPGQHITIYNATLLLTAEQYILVGPGASLTLKGVEILGCGRDAAVASAAVRRRALSGAAAAAAVAASSLAQQHSSMSVLPGGGVGGSVASGATTAPGAAGSAVSVARQLRRTSSPGRGEAYFGLAAAGAVAAAATAFRRVSVNGSEAGLPAVVGRRRSTNNTYIGGGATAAGGGANGNTGGAFVLSIPPPLIIPNSTGIQELVDSNEYVDEHGLLEIQGGYARISNCRLWPSRIQLAMCVSAGGAASVQYSTAGAVCAAGPRSALTVEHTTVEGSAAGCVSILHGARAGVTGCRLRNGGDGSSTGGALSAGGGAAASNAGVCEVGLEARGGGALAVVSDCELSGCGAVASAGARLHLAASRVAYARGHGLMARDAGTTLYGRDVRIDDARRSGAVAVDGAAMRLVDAFIAGCSGGPGVLLMPPTPTSPSRFGARAGSGGDIIVSSAALLSYDGGGGLYDVASVPLAAPAPAAPRTSIALLRCAVSANAGHGMLVTGGGLGQVCDTELYNNMFCGVEVEGRGSWLAAAGARLIRNESQGVRAVGGGGAALTRCTSTGNGRDGVAAEGTGTIMRLTKCESRENRESGLCVTGAAAVNLSQCRLAGNQHDGLAVGGQGSMAVAEGCAMSGNLSKGAMVCMGGAAELAECAVHCNGSKSVQVMDDGSRLALHRDCSIDRNPVATNGAVLVRL